MRTRSRSLFAVLLAAAMLAGVLVNHSSAAPNTAPAVVEFQFLDLINAERAVRGLSTLQMSSQLTNLARSWSSNMAAQKKLYHNPKLAGDYDRYIGTRWTAGGENVGVGYDAPGLHAAFKASPTHWKNIIDSRWNYIGIGVVYSSDGKLWTTHNFVRSSTALAVAPRPATVGSFTDVPANSYYAKAVEWGSKRGITTGCTSTKFCPNDPVTRAQMITMLWRQAGSPAVSKRHSFKDVPSGSYYDKAVSWAVSKGITTGCTSTKFCPNDPTIRAQVVTLLYRSAGSPAVSKRHSFKDVPSGSYYDKAVSWAVSKGITTGCAPDRFCPNDPTIRAQAITFTWRMAGSPKP